MSLTYSIRIFIRNERVKSRGSFDVGFLILMWVFKSTGSSNGGEMFFF